MRVREVGVSVVQRDLEIDGCGGHVHTGAGARDRQAVFDAGGRCVYDLGTWDSGDGPRGARVVAKPGSITPHRKFKAETYILTKEEGGRHTPFFNGYRPQFYFRTTDVTGVATLP